MSDHIAMEHMPARDLAALVRLGLALAGSRDLTDILQTATECAVEILGMDTGSIYVKNRAGMLWLGGACPPRTDGRLRRTLDLDGSDHPHVWRCIESGQPALIADLRSATLSDVERAIVEVAGLRSVYMMPLRLDSGCFGVLVAGSRTRIDHFGENRTALASVLAVQIAFAVSNARLLEGARLAAAEIACAYDATLEGWALALDMRDSETRGHTERAARLAVDIAETLGIENGDLLKIRRGALLHDIGKLGVPDAILNKPGPLTDDEWVVMRQHPANARDFLSRIDYLSESVDIPYCHHERWDGTGYPQGPRGEQIPLGARISAVIDVHDALNSDRPYRKAWSAYDAQRYLQEEAGRQFDPQVVAAFLERLNGCAHS